VPSVKIIVTGKVQGVFYRDSCKRKTTDLNITGYAKNMDDGSVEIIATGEKNNLISLVEWCWKGSQSSKVTSVDYNWLKTEKNFKSFQVR